MLGNPQTALPARSQVLCLHKFWPDVTTDLFGDAWIMELKSFSYMQAIPVDSIARIMPSLNRPVSGIDSQRAQPCWGPRLLWLCCAPVVEMPQP